MMTTKTLPELPADGTSVDFLPWRPYSKKTMLRDLTMGLGLATTGLVLSQHGPSVLGLTAAVAGAISVFKLWRTSVKARKHNAMLIDVTKNLANTLSSNESNIRSHVVMSEYFLSRPDIRAWMADVIKNCKYNVILDQKGRPEHYFSWKLPETDNVILTATIISIIDAAFVHASKTGPSMLGFKSLEGAKSILTDDKGHVSEYKIRLTERDSAEITDALTMYFTYHIEFFLHTWNLYSGLKLTPNTTSTYSDKTSVALKINACSNWELENGLVLEIVQNINKGLDTTILDVDGSRGMTLTHPDFESINKTWGHLVK